MTRQVTNFGRNVRFAPRHAYEPTTEAEVLAVLDRHATGTVRVAGALHSWSPLVETPDALLDLRHFNRVSVAGGVVTIGGGCRIKHALRQLNRLGLTLPSVGLIAEQAVAGAVATATHGSGRHSLSHYVCGLRVAAYDPATGKARVYDWGEGDPELPAARCALGCMGVVLAVRFRCVPRYDIAERMVRCDALDEVLAGEAEFPLQQFYLVPHAWTYFVQRRAARPLGPRHWSAGAYRAWWLLGIDVGLHVAVKLATLAPGVARFFFRRVLPPLIVRNVTTVDRAERVLVMRHELFRHFETEVFVPARHVRRAVELVRGAIEVFDGAPPSATILALAGEAGMTADLLRLRGTFTHHYPVTFRRVLPDDALISTTGGAAEPHYAISLITYAEPREPFLGLASFVARAAARLFGGRPHWGKWFPLDGGEVAKLYPRLDEFRAACDRVDPHGVFRNEFVERVLFGK